MSCNGAVVTDPVSGDDLRVQTMDPAEATALRTVHEETGYAFTWWTVRGIYTTTEQLRDLLMAFGDPDVQLAVPPERMPDDVVKAMIHGTAAEMDAARPAIERYTPRATRSMDVSGSCPIRRPRSGRASRSSSTSSTSIPRAPQASATGRTTSSGCGRSACRWRWATPVPEARAVARAVTGHHADEGAADFLEEVLRQLRQRAA